jgi:uncharacterized protein (DUF1778 family)
MLDFDISKASTEESTRTTQIRHGDGLGDLITEAATSLGVDKSVFLRAAIEKEALRVLESASHHTLTEDDARRFTTALDAAPAPTPRALAAAKAYAARVVHAD